MNIIKQISILGAVAALVTGCSQHEGVSVTSSNDDYAEIPVHLTVKVKSGLNMASPSSRTDYDSNLNTAPRQLVLWHAEQAINDMRVYVFRSDSADGEYLYAGGGDCADGAYSVPEFCNTTPWCPVLRPDDPYETHMLTFKPALRKGSYYKFLAVGRDDVNCDKSPFEKNSVLWGSKQVYSDIELEPGVTPLTEMKIKNRLKESNYPYVSTEVFSGVMTYENAQGKIVDDYIYVDDKAVGFQKNIVLHRAVAGLWVYVTDIPTKAVINYVDKEADKDKIGNYFDVRELTIVMPRVASEINLYSCDGKGVSTLNDVPVGYVDFRNFYPEDGYKTYWSHKGGYDYWMHPAINDYLGFKINENCALMTNFLLPTDSSELGNSEYSTFIVQLKDTDGPLGTTRCNIKCHIETIVDVKTGESRPYKGDSKHFPIVANCIYTLGTPEAPLSLANIGKASSRSSEEIPTIEMGMTVFE